MANRVLLFFVLACLMLPPVHAQTQGKGPAKTPDGSPEKKPAKAAPSKPAATPQTQDQSGLYGPYPLSREASGTSWQPESSLLQGIQEAEGEAMFLLQGYLYGIYDNQSGPRGGDKTIITNVTSLIVRQGLKNGVLGFRVMLSLDPVQGSRGYPLLFQTGGQADDEPLIDRQRPDEFFSELAVTYSMPRGEDRSLFVYAGLPGEPALGPPAYEQRFSAALNNPEAPLSRQWLDATHITFGVITLGYIVNRLKLEASAFRGKEPDDLHWNIEQPEFDSYSGRITFNASRDISLQASYGSLKSPYRLLPEVDVGRFTASVVYNAARKTSDWQTTFAWGLNAKDPGPDTSALLLESAVTLRQKHTLFGRLERVEQDALFASGDPLYGQVFTVDKGSIGYSYRFLNWKRLGLDAGGLVSGYVVPASLQPVYGDAPFSYMLFVRAKFI